MLDLFATGPVGVPVEFFLREGEGFGLGTTTGEGTRNSGLDVLGWNIETWTITHLERRIQRL